MIPELLPVPQALLSFTVWGDPKPKGSLTPMVSKSTGRAIVLEGRNADQRRAINDWRQNVASAAALALETADMPAFVGPVRLTVTFTLARPRSHFGTGRNARSLRPSAPNRPTGKPDLDKLERAVCDALTAAGVYRDDAQVVSKHGEKVYPFGGPDALNGAGAVIHLEALT